MAAPAADHAGASGAGGDDELLADLVGQLASRVGEGPPGSPAEAAAPDREPQGKAVSPWRLLSLSKPEWPALCRAALVALACIACDTIVPEVKAIIDDLVLNPHLEEESIYGIVSFQFSDDTESEVRRLTLVMLLLRAASLVLGIIKGITFGLVAARVVTRMRLQLFQAILTQDMGFFDRRTSGELSSRLGADAERVQFVAANAAPDTALALIRLSVLMGMMFAQSWHLSLLMLALIPAMLLYAGGFTPLLMRLNKDYQDRLAGSSDIATQAIGSVRVVRAFGAETFAGRLYAHAIGDIGGGTTCICSWWPKSSKSIYRAGVVKSLVEQIVIQGTIGLGSISFQAIMWCAFDMVIDSKITYGTLGAFTTYGMLSIVQAAFLGRCIFAIGPAMGASARIFEVIDRRPSIAVEGGEIPTTLSGDIAFQGVHFAYPSRPDVQILSELSFSIPARTKAALVGASGAGKSTVLALVERLYDANGGQVLIDGKDVRTLNPQWLRRRIGTVQQEPVLFGFSIHENLLYGRLAAAVAEGTAEPSEEDIVEAAKEANAHDFITGFPDGYSTRVGERGIRLSGGQKQRIAIARAILCDPSIMLLDEATSALDGESESLVQQALERVMASRTVVIVAHRLSTVIGADRIMVMSAAGLVATGKHEDLLQTCSVYKELVHHQLEAKDGPTASAAHGAAVAASAAASAAPPAAASAAPPPVAALPGALPVAAAPAPALGPALGPTPEVSLAVGAVGTANSRSRGELDFDRLQQIVLQNNKDAGKPAAGEKAAAAPGRAPARFVLKLIGLELPVLICALLFCLCATAMELYMPLLQGDGVDFVVGPLSGDAKKIETRRIMVTLICMSFGIQLVHYLRVVIFCLAAERIVARTRLWAFSAIFKQDLAFFEAQTTGDLTSRLVNDAQMVQLGVGSGGVEVVLGLVKGTVALVMSLAVSWELALMTLASFVVTGLVLAPAIGPGVWIYQKYQEALGRSTNVSTEAIGAMRTVISYGSERFVGMLYGTAIGQLDGPSTWCWWPRRSRNTYAYMAFAYVGMRVVMQLAIFLASALTTLIFWYAYIRILRGELTFGDMYSFSMYAVSIVQGFGFAAGGAGGVAAAVGALGRIHEVWSREPSSPVDQGERPDGLVMDVCLEDVSFAYTARADVRVLQSVNFQVPANTSAAFVGSSGCGKSTILQLIVRFYDAETGVVRVGGRDIRSLDASWLRRRIGVVQQEPVLFGFSVRSNITYGRDAMRVVEGGFAPSQEEVEGAAKTANAHGFIGDFPEGYRTMVGERGVLLSGGQKQRVAIARALLTAPKMLLFDEATSALDAESEHLVQEAIDRVSENRTVLFVAHRLSTVRNADQILVVDEGRIVDAGPHQALLDRCTRYQELLSHQDHAAKCNGR